MVGDTSVSNGRAKKLLALVGLGVLGLSSGAHAQGTTTPTGFDPTAIIQGLSVNSQQMLVLVADATPYVLAVVGLVAGFRFLRTALKAA